MPESKKKKLEDADEVMTLKADWSIVSTSFQCWSALTLRFSQCLQEEEEEEEQSIVAEEDGVVQVPLEGYK